MGDPASKMYARIGTGKTPQKAVKAARKVIEEEMRDRIEAIGRGIV